MLAQKPARAAVLATVLLVMTVLGACGEPTSPATTEAKALGATGAVPALQPATETPAPCDGGFAYGLVADIGGDPTAEAALQTWLDGTRTDLSVAPPSAPRAGWAAWTSRGGDVRSFAAGTWTVDVWRSTRGEWVVNAQGCQPELGSGSAR